MAAQAWHIKAKRKVNLFLLKDVGSELLDSLQQDPVQASRLIDSVDSWAKVLVDGKNISKGKKVETVGKWRPEGWQQFIQGLKTPVVATSVDLIDNPTKIGVTHRFICGNLVDMVGINIAKDDYGKYLY